jgi:hypothetical protein
MKYMDFIKKFVIDNNAITEKKDLEAILVFAENVTVSV